MLSHLHKPTVPQVSPHTIRRTLTVVLPVVGQVANVRPINGIQRVWPISNVSQFTTDWRGRIFRPYCWRTVPYDDDGFGSNSASQWSEVEALEMRKAHARALLLEHVWQGGKLFVPTMESMLWHLDAIIQGCSRCWWIRMVYFFADQYLVLTNLYDTNLNPAPIIGTFRKK